MDISILAIRRSILTTFVKENRRKRKRAEENRREKKDKNKLVQEDAEKVINR